MPKFYVLFFLFLLTGKLNAQFDDLIVWSNADKVYCEITSMNSDSIQFKFKYSEFLQTVSTSNIDYVIFAGSKDRLYINKKKDGNKKTKKLVIEKRESVFSTLKPTKGLRPGFYWSLENHIGASRGINEQIEITMGLSVAGFKRQKAFGFGGTVGFFGFEPLQKKYILSATSDLYYFPKKINNVNFKLSLGYGYASDWLSESINSRIDLIVDDARGGINSSFNIQKTFLALDKLRINGSLGIGIQEAEFVTQFLNNSGVYITQDLLFVRFWGSVGILF